MAIRKYQSALNRMVLTHALVLAASISPKDEESKVIGVGDGKSTSFPVPPSTHERHRPTLGKSTLVTRASAAAKGLVKATKSYPDLTGKTRKSKGERKRTGWRVK